MYSANNWRSKSLEVLESQSWDGSSSASTNLVKRCIELCKVPLNNFTLADLRIMIGQQFGLAFLIPLALEKLQNDIFTEAEFYPGDLLSAVLEVDATIWDANPKLWSQLNELIKVNLDEILLRKISINKFQSAKAI